MGNDPRWLPAILAKAILIVPAVLACFVLWLWGVIDEWQKGSQWDRPK